LKEEKGEKVKEEKVEEVKEEVPEAQEKSGGILDELLGK
jgi:hypothetical protein